MHRFALHSDAFYVNVSHSLSAVFFVNPIKYKTRIEIAGSDKNDTAHVCFARVSRF